MYLKIDEVVVFFYSQFKSCLLSQSSLHDPFRGQRLTWNIFISATQVMSINQQFFYFGVEKHFQEQRYYYQDNINYSYVEYQEQSSTIAVCR